MKHKWFEYAAFRTPEYWGFWIRLFGYGFAVSNMTPCFSQRAGLSRYFRIGPVKIEPLTP